MFVKFCGFTRREDLEAAAWFPVNALGFVFHPPSARYIDPGRARDLIDGLPLPAKKVGVFVDQSPEEIRRVAETVGLDMLQVYRPEQAAALKGFLPLIRAYGVAGVADLHSIDPPEDGSFLLLDRYDGDRFGGTGKAFDWGMLEGFPYLDRTLVAGGINAGNLSRLLETVRPRGIDLSSGIESAPGVKSVSKMNAVMTIIEEHRHATTAR